MLIEVFVQTGEAACGREYAVPLLLLRGCPELVT
jgi:hypothetical protein